MAQVTAPAQLLSPAKHAASFLGQRALTAVRNEQASLAEVARPRALTASLRQPVCVHGTIGRPSLLAPLTSQSSSPSPFHQNIRSFHSSPPRSLGDYTYNEEIPPYYAARKARLQQEAEGVEPTLTDEVSQHKDAEGKPLRVKRRSKSLYEGVMEHVSSSIPDGSGMRRLPAKIPVEHFTFNEEGKLTGRIHASGFEVPHHNLVEPTDLAAKGRVYHSSKASDSGTVTIDGKYVDRVVPSESSNVLPQSVLIDDSSDSRRVSEDDTYEMTPKQKQLQAAAVAERMLEEVGLREGQHARQRRLAAKIPWEHTTPDGSIAHSSGFVPPTPIGKFGTAEEIAAKLAMNKAKSGPTRANEYGREDLPSASGGQANTSKSKAA